MYVGKIPFCRPSVPQRGARRATAGRFGVNSAEFTANLPHVPPLSEKAKGLFRQAEAALSGGSMFLPVWIQKNVPHYRIAVVSFFVCLSLIDVNFICIIQNALLLYHRLLLWYLPHYLLERS